MGLLAQRSLIRQSLPTTIANNRNTATAVRAYNAHLRVSKIERHIAEVCAQVRARDRRRRQTSPPGTPQQRPADGFERRRVYCARTSVSVPPDSNLAIQVSTDGRFCSRPWSWLSCRPITSSWSRNLEADASTRGIAAL